MVAGMNELAYDIAYLLESEPALAERPPVRAAAAPVPRPPDIAELQDALAQELMHASGAHEELIRQYLAMTGESWRDNSQG